MKILFVASELAPLTKVGGLADVVRSLPHELIKRGHDVRVMIPCYGFIDMSKYTEETIIDGLPVLALNSYRKAGVKQSLVENTIIYLVTADIFTEAREVYGVNEVEKFFTFCQCAIELLPRLGWSPDIIHCHDWHAALLPLMIREKKIECSSILTIHNIRYQGFIDEDIVHSSGLEPYWSAGLPDGSSVPHNFLSQGILWADVINTVSETHAREIMTEAHGCGMDRLLNMRPGRVFGIRNGLSCEEYNPKTDKYIAASYNSAQLESKYLNKRSLQCLAGLKEDDSIPVIGMVSRLDEQKGFDLLIEALPQLAAETQAQFIILGRGQPYYEEILQYLQRKYTGNISALITFDNEKAHLVYAGSDMFLMPSKWEPCGLGQLIAMRYGTVPVVRKTGGLADTVYNLSESLEKGTGFLFNKYDADHLIAVIKKAISAYGNRSAWGNVVKRIMEQDFNWQKSVDKYEESYRFAREVSGYGH